MCDLAAQTANGLLEFAQVVAHRTDTLVNAGAENTALAHLVDQVIEQRGTDPDGIGSGRGLGAHGGFRRSGSAGHGRRGSGHHGGHRLDPLLGLAAEQGMQRLDLLGLWRRLYALTHPDQHAVQAVEGQLQLFQYRRRIAQGTLAERIEHRFSGMSQIADAHKTGQARAALKGVHLAAQIVKQLAVIGFDRQALQDHVAGVENFGRFALEDLDQFLVELGHGRNGRGFRHCGSCGLDRYDR